MEQSYFELEEGAVLRIEDLHSGTEMSEKVYGKLVSINKTPYPNNFDICPYFVQDESVLVGVDETQYGECHVPEFIKSFATQQAEEQYPHKVYPDSSEVSSTGPTVEPTNEPTLEPINISPTAESFHGQISR